MTIEELEEMVPVIENRYVRLIDIPNPWRSEFVADSKGSTCPIVRGQGDCSYAWDWSRWLSFRSKSDYKARYFDTYRLISDEEASRTIELPDS